MELITLLIRIPTIITWSIALLNFIVIFSNRIPIEKFLKVRKWLGMARWVTNLIAIIVIFYFKFYGIAFGLAGLMLWSAIEDIIILGFFKNYISKK